MTGDVVARSSVTLASEPANEAQERAAICAVCLGLVLGLFSLPFARFGGPPSTGFFLINEALLCVAYALSAWVLAAQYRRQPSLPLLMIAAGTLYTAAIIVLQMMSIPGLVGTRRLLGAGPETTTWLWTFWHLGPPCCALLYALFIDLARTQKTSTRIPYAVLIATGLAVAAALAAAFVATTCLPWLPEQVTVDNYRALTTSGVGPAVSALTAVSLVVVWRRTRHRRSVLELWIAVSLVLLLLDNALTLRGGARGTVGWYVGRLEALFSAFAILLAYLHEVEALRTRSERAAAELLRAETALRQAQRMEAVGRLTGGVAHDFNNLLMIVGSSLEMIKRRSADPERVVKSAEAGLEAVQRGARLTRQLLTFARRQSLSPETLNLNGSLMEFEPLARRALGEAIAFQIRLDPALHPAHIDRTEFESAVLNLVVNARDAVSPQTGQVIVKTRNDRHEGGTGADIGAPKRGEYVVISVEDNGSGMDETTRAQVFEPFFTTKEFGRGSGLGLSQVYGFAHSAGGSVTIASTLQRGTTVEIWLPRAERLVASTIGHGAAAQLRHSVEGETVLAVEDEPAVLAAVTDNLLELGYRVLTACDANEALNHLRSDERIDVLFSDVVMPGGMNGLQLAVEAARIRPELRVLLTSGYTDEALSEHSVPASTPVLAKPYRPEDLAARLHVASRSRAPVTPTRRRDVAGGLSSSAV